MKFLTNFIITVLVSYIIGAFFPWWTIFPFIAIIYALMPLKPFVSFLCGFSALFFLWAILSFIIDVSNNHLLSKKMAMIFLQNDQYGYLILITALIGGVIGGLSALTGTLARRLF